MNLKMKPNTTHNRFADPLVSTGFRFFFFYFCFFYFFLLLFLVMVNEEASIINKINAMQRFFIKTNKKCLLNGMECKRRLITNMYERRESVFV